MSCWTDREKDDETAELMAFDPGLPAGAYLADASGPVPHKVVPVSVVVLTLIHDLRHQVVHGHAEHLERPQLMGEGLLLVGRGATVLFYGGCMIHLGGTEQRVVRTSDTNNAASLQKPDYLFIYHLFPN